MLPVGVVDEASVQSRVLLPAAQLALIGVLLWVLFTGESDSTSTEIDWAFMALVIFTPLSLAGSFWAGRRFRQRASEQESVATRLITRGAQGLTLALLIPAAIICPLAAFGGLFFSGM